MEDLKVSIIVPVYNSERWLPRCIESLLDQGLPQDGYEIILVNDGSTDGSLAICEKYKKEYKNVVVASQSNQGVGMARNHGLEIANGEYVCFVDSDDYIVKNGLSYIFSHYDLTGFDLLRYWCAIEYGKEPQEKLSGGGKVFRQWHTIY